MKYHFTRDMVEKNIVDFRHCNTLDNITNNIKA